MGSSHRVSGNLKYATEFRSTESKQVVEKGINKFENSSEEITQTEVKRKIYQGIK